MDNSFLHNSPWDDQLFGNILEDYPLDGEMTNFELDGELLNEIFNFDQVNDPTSIFESIALQNTSNERKRSIDAIDAIDETTGEGPVQKRRKVRFSDQVDLLETQKQEKRKRAEDSFHVLKKARQDNCGDDNGSDPTVVLSCGTGEFGELGHGPEETLINRPRPIPYFNESMTQVRDVTCGGMHTLVALRNGSVVSWGVNDDNALARDTSDSDAPHENNVPENVPGIISAFPVGTEIVRIAACDSYSFFLTKEGLLYGCGVFRFPGGRRSSTMQPDNHQDDATKPHLISLGGRKAKIVDLSAGANHVVVLLMDGSVWTWGSGEDFQLGRRTSTRNQKSSLTPCCVYRGKGANKAVAVFAGGNNTFVKTTNGAILACGSNSFGECGIDFSSSEYSAIKKLTVVTNLKQFKISQIAVGEGHAIALTTTGDLIGWGRCDCGQIGDISKVAEEFIRRNEVTNLPASVSISKHFIGHTFTSVSCGAQHSIGIDGNGEAWSWGSGLSRQIGQGPDNKGAFPIPTKFINRHVEGIFFTHVAAGAAISIFAGEMVRANEL